jgi:anaerobic selenocysteine-containing dehydrogenase
MSETSTNNEAAGGEDWKQTICVLCYVNCGVEVRTTDRGITKIRGDKANPKSHGYACQKAQRLAYYADRSQRLTTPLKRRADGTGHDVISWEQAFAEIGERLLAIKAEHGGEAFLFYGGGGQGNHLGAIYYLSLFNALGAMKSMNALSQEKTGDFWVNGRLFGSQSLQTAEDVEHTELLFVLGCNPWLGHGFQEARKVVNDFKRDRDRKMIVVDPRRTEVADVADLHLQLRPGSDAYLLSAILSIILRRGAEAAEFIAARTTGFDEVRDVLLAVPVEKWVEASGVTLEAAERAADMIIAAGSMVVRVELGIQQSRNSTLNSYLEKLLYLLTGNFGRRGTNNLHTWLQPLMNDSQGQRSTATGQEIISTLLPAARFSDEILVDHPARVRAVWVDSSNPANTSADTKRFEEAMAALDLSVVVDIAYTETARLADYVLPAASQYEKWECTFFTLEFPTNYFQLRKPLFEPLEGTLTEPEIYTRLLSTMGLLPDAQELDRLTAIARVDREQFLAEATAMFFANPSLVPVAPVLLYQTLGATLPDGAAAAAPLWMASRQTAALFPSQVQRALGTDLEGAALGNLVFDRVLASRSGLAFTAHEYEEVWDLVIYPDRRIRMAIPELLDWIRRLDPSELTADSSFPLVLSAGQRRSHNANQIMRSPAWRKSDPDGSLWANEADLEAAGIANGDWAVVETRRGSLVVRAEANDTYPRGYCALPHGYGQVYGSDGVPLTVEGPRVNILTDREDCDPIAATPYHKNVAARLRQATPEETAAAESNALRLRNLASRSAVAA